MTIVDRLLARRTFSIRPITLVLLQVTCLLLLCSGSFWLGASRVHAPSESETRAIRAALAQFRKELGRDAADVESVKATELDGMQWIVQVKERISPEPGGLRERNTFFVTGSNCRWFCRETWGAY